MDSYCVGKPEMKDHDYNDFHLEESELSTEYVRIKFWRKLKTTSPIDLDFWIDGETSMKFINAIRIRDADWGMHDEVYNFVEVIFPIPEPSEGEEGEEGEFWELVLHDLII